MDMFYIIVVVIAALLLLSLLIYIGIMMNSSSTNTQSFPPVANSCPDYWKYDPSGGVCVVPQYKDGVNKGSIGSIYNDTGAFLLSDASGGLYGLKPYKTITSIDPSTKKETQTTTEWAINFGDARWNSNGLLPICNQKTWANSNSIMFDGVSNYNGC